MHEKLKLSLAAVGLALTLPALAQLTVYEREGFGGSSFNTARAISNLTDRGFNDRVASAVVQNERWEVCEDARFEGRCRVLQPGRYASLSAMGLNERVGGAKLDRPELRA